MQEVFEKVIERLEELHERYIKQYGVVGGNPMAFAVKECIDIVELIVNQEAEKFGTDTNVGSNGWIPCSERLPTTEEYQRGNGRFLVTDGNRTYEAEFDIYESHTFGKSRMATDWFITDKCVTHWQNEPLPPAPYQPKGE